MKWPWKLLVVLLEYAILLGIGWLIGVLEKRDLQKLFTEERMKRYEELDQ